MFVSGYTCMLAYGGALREQGWQTIITRSLRRGFEIYAAFLLLVIAYLVLIWVIGSSRLYLAETNTRFFLKIRARRWSTSSLFSMLQLIPIYCQLSLFCIWPFR